MRKVLALSLTLFFVTSGCFIFGTNANEYNYRARGLDPRNTPYVIGPGDVLDVHVWKDEELSTEARVRPDGTITIPLVGEVRAAGRTADALREEISTKVRLYVNDAVVTVAVTAINSYRFTVTGEVGHAGVFTPPPYVTVAEAIALAGGPNRYASPDEIVVIRQRDPKRKPERISIDYEAILDGKRPEQDIVILSGDTIYVP